MKVGKASGIDNVTKYEYETDLKENIENLVGRMKRVTTHIINTWVEKRKYYPCIIVIGSVYGIGTLCLPAIDDLDDGIKIGEGHRL